MTYDLALDALGDRTRRKIFEILRGGPRAVGEIAARLPVSRPAVSQHLKVLRDAGLVTDHAEGTRRVYEIRAQGVADTRAYFDRMWGEALERFKEVADSRGTPPHGRGGRSGRVDRADQKKRHRGSRRR